jgi:phosphoribosylglycinamide formyltransferase-1
MKKLAVLISNKGTGSNLQAIIDGIEQKKINAKIVVVISDEEDAYGLVRAKNHKIKTTINKQKENLIKILKKYKPDFICLTGWKQILTDEVLATFPNQIINTHPGLIPDTMDSVVKNPDGTNALWNKGKFTDKAMQSFLDEKKTYAGCTNHFLSTTFDFGKVNGRCFEKIKKDDTIASLYERLKQKENKLYVDCLAKLCQ